LVVGAPEAADTGNAFVYNFDGGQWIQTFSLELPDGDTTSAGFGEAVCVSGDTIVIGTPDDGFAANRSGSVHVYELKNGTWDHQQRVIPSDPKSSSAFGSIIALFENRFVVGVETADGTDERSGAAYVFEKVGETWEQIEKLDPVDGEPGDNFGASVAISHNRVVVGNPREDDDSTPVLDSGSVYVYEFVEDSSTPKALLLASDRTRRHLFGAGLAVDQNHLAVFADNNEGQIYLFNLNGSGNDQQAPSISMDPSTITIDESGSVGLQVIALGLSPLHYQWQESGDQGATWSDIPGKNENVLKLGNVTNLFGNNKYRVIVSNEVGAVTSNDASVTIDPVAPILRSFAINHRRSTVANRSVSLVHEHDGGLPTEYRASESIDFSDASWQLHSSTPVFNLSDNPGEKTVYFQIRNEAGESEVLSDSITRNLFDGSGPEAATKLLISDGIDEDHFGKGVAIDGDTSVVSAPRHERSDGGVGTLYVYVRDGVEWILQATLFPETELPGQSLLERVAVDDDTIVVESTVFVDGELNKGVYIFIREGNQWHEEALLVPSDGVLEDNFGVSICIFEDTVLIGASGQDNEKGAVYVFNRTGENWTESGKLAASDGNHGDLFGWSASIDEDTAFIGAPADRLDGVQFGSAYIFTRSGDSWAEAAKLAPRDSVFLNSFGYSVSLQGDWAAIGNPQATEEEGATGSVSMYRRNSGTWEFFEKLTDPFAKFNHRLGFSLSLDSSILLAGSLEDNNVGAAFLYEFDGNAWVMRSKVVPENSESFRQFIFGFDVSTTSEYSIVGAFGESSGFNENGSVYIYNVSDLVNHVEPVSIEDENYDFSSFVTDGAELSVTVSGAQPITYQWQISSDNQATWQNIDGETDSIFRSKPLAEVNQNDWYRVVVTNSVGEDTSEPKLLSMDIDLPDFWEIKVNENDPVTTIPEVFLTFSTSAGFATQFRIGENPDLSDASWQENIGGLILYNLSDGAGEKTIFTQFRNPFGETEIKSSTILYAPEDPPIAGPFSRIVPGDPEEFDQFGFSVDIYGDLAVVGSPYEDSNGTNSGGAYVFKLSGKEWIEQAKLLGTDTVENNNFGMSVALFGDTIVVGAPFNDHTKDAAGSVYVFATDGTNWSQQAKLNASDDLFEAQFGYDVSIFENTILVGAPTDQANGVLSGSAYVYTWSSNSWLLNTKLVNPNADSRDNFGRTVDIFDNTILIGTPRDRDPTRDSGSTYVYQKNGSDSWNLVRKFRPHGASGDIHFGFSVALYDDTAIIGAVHESVSGSAYSYDLKNAYITNRPPGFNAIPDFEISEFETVSFTPQVIDSDNSIEELSFSLVGINPNFEATIDPDTGDFSWTPQEANGPSDYVFVLKISDGFDEDFVSFNVSVDSIFTNYEGWQEDEWPTGIPGNQLGKEFDIDFDGYSNFLEYAFGMDPFVPDPFQSIQLSMNSMTNAVELDTRLMSFDDSLFFTCLISYNLLD